MKKLHSLGDSIVKGSKNVYFFNLKSLHSTKMTFSVSMKTQTDPVNDSETTPVLKTRKGSSVCFLC